MTGLMNVSVGQSPWLPAKGHYYLQFSYNTIPEYTTLFNKDFPTIETSRSVSDKTLQVYSEYGLSNKFAIVASLPYKLLKTGSINQNYLGETEEIPESDMVNSLGNIQLSVRYKLMEAKWASAFQLRVGLPANNEVGENSGLYPGYDAFSFTPSLSIGRGWNSTYVFSWASYIIRTNNYSGQFDVGVEGGWRPTSKLWLITYFNALISNTDGNKTPPPWEKQLGLYSNYQEYTAYGLKIIYEVPLKEEKKLGFIAHGAGSFSGHLVAKSPLLSLGVFLKN